MLIVFDLRFSLPRSAVNVDRGLEETFGLVVECHRMKPRDLQLDNSSANCYLVLVYQHLWGIASVIWRWHHNGSAGRLDSAYA